MKSTIKMIAAYLFTNTSSVSADAKSVLLNTALLPWKNDCQTVFLFRFNSTVLSTHKTISEHIINNTLHIRENISPGIKNQNQRYH